ncbi:MAG: DUF4112 domain-containing protein [Chitinophagaceae bacterium]|nr:MAG: DUF4112 domain-containing protein [Chitinophagaceae bacterium]
MQSNTPEKDYRLATIQKMSKLLDNQFKIGKFKFGIDPILNIIPVAGDFVGFIMSILLIITMIKHGASGKLVFKMVRNAALDALVGTIPILGTIFDFGFKANARNVKLLQEHYTQNMHHGSAANEIKKLILWVLIFGFVILIVVVYLSYLLFDWIIKNPESFF